MDSTQQQIKDMMQQLKDASDRQIEREQVFAEHAEQRFRDNLAAFRKFYPKIADSIEAFSSDKPLELFVTASGQGNIKEHVTGYPLYGDDPIEQVARQVEEQLAKPMVNHIDFAKYAEVPEDDTRVHARYLKQLGEAVAEAGAVEKLAPLPDRFPTAVVFGVGLGYHIPMLMERVQFDYIYLIEPSFENFYCSLYCTDWRSIIEQVDEQRGVLTFQLGASYQTFIDDLYRVSQDIGVFSLTKCFCYQHYPSKENATLLREFFMRLFELHGGYGFYNDATTALAHTVQNAKQGMNLLKHKTEDSNRYRDYPVYVVGNGPSLDESIEFIKDTQEHALIIAAGTALQTLLKHDIVPDFHTLVERPKSTYDVLLKSLPKETYSKLNLLTMNLIYPNVVPLYQWVGMAGKGIDASGDLLNYVLLNEAQQALRYLPFCNPLVANTALSYAAHMGFKEIYMFGVDNGYSADGRHHSKDSAYYQGALKDWKPHDARHELAGNLGGTVMSSNFLAMSCQQMGRLLGLPKFADIHCYNVGEGAKVNHALPLKPEHVLPEPQQHDKSQVVDYIKDELFNHFQFEHFERYMAFDRYDEICDHLIAISEEPITSRAEALDNLRRQARYLYSHRQTRYSHLHYVLEGEMLYFQCPLVVLLYNANDEAQCLTHFKKALDVWRRFVLEAREDLKTAWLEKCTRGYKPKVRKNFRVDEQQPSA